MKSYKSGLKIFLGILMAVFCTIGCDTESKAQVPEGVFVDSSGLFEYDFQADGNGRQDVFRSTEEGVKIFDKSTPFAWETREGEILIYVEGFKSSFQTMTWYEDDLIIEGSNNRLSKK